MVAFKNFLKVIELVIKLINTIAKLWLTGLICSPVTMIAIVTYKQKIRKEKFL